MPGDICTIYRQIIAESQGKSQNVIVLQAHNLLF